MFKKDLWINYSNEVGEKLAKNFGIAIGELSSLKESELKKAECGDVDAQFFVGFISIFDPCRNATQSSYWLEKSASEGSADAHMTLGMMNYCGHAELKLEMAGFITAIQRFYNAAELGHGFAKKMLDLMISDHVDRMQREYGRTITEMEFDKISKMLLLIAEGRTHECMDDIFASSWVASEPEECDCNAMIKAATEGFHSNKDQKFYVTPDIPHKKIENFLGKKNFELNPQEVIFYFDETVFGAGDNGVAVDQNNINVQLPFGETYCVPMLEVRDISIGGLVNKTILINKTDDTKTKITLTQSNAGAKTLFEAINTIIRLKKQAAAK